jgi:hypothetical protein
MWVKKEKKFFFLSLSNVCTHRQYNALCALLQRQTFFYLEYSNRSFTFFHNLLLNSPNKPYTLNRHWKKRVFFSPIHKAKHNSRTFFISDEGNTSFSLLRLIDLIDENLILVFSILYTSKPREEKR